MTLVFNSELDSIDEIIEKLRSIFSNSFMKWLSVNCFSMNKVWIPFKLFLIVSNKLFSFISSQFSISNKNNFKSVKKLKKNYIIKTWKLWEFNIYNYNYWKIKFF